MASETEAASVAGPSSDVRTLFAAMPMRKAQWLAILLTAAINALDGYDLLAISFAAPKLTAAWHVSRAALGIIIGAGLAGVALGSALLAPWADRTGRRAMVLLCMVLMIVGMGLAALSRSPAELILCRLATGVGVGGMLPAIAALAAEYANDRRRELAVGILAMGYATGGAAGGLIASWLLARFGWQSVFVTGAVLALLLLPAILIWLPESLSFRIARDGAAALPYVNQQLVRIGAPPLEALPMQRPAQRLPFRDLAQSRYLRITIVMAAAYLLHSITTYFFLGWIPQLIADRGFGTAESARAAAAASIGGLIGGLLLSLLAHRLGARRITTLCLAGSTAMIVWFALAAPSLPQLVLIATLAGLFVFPGTGGILMMLAILYPTHLRATGAGVVIGVGRIGAAIGPMLAGWLLSLGATPEVETIAISTASLIAAMLLLTVTTAPKPPKATGHIVHA